MRHAIVRVGLGLVALAATLSGDAGQAPASRAASRPIVVTELFTSEGCSSCPPADRLLEVLATQQPIAGAEIVALSEHVDYFDHQGWQDPFGSAFFTRRQSQYDSRVFHDDVYTPQIVVDGRFARVGSDVKAVQESIRQAMQLPKASVAIDLQPSTARKVDVSIHVQVPDALARGEAADILVAVTESGLVSDVRRGENEGRRLTHTGVVRRMQSVGLLPPNERTAAAKTVVTLESSWRREHLRIVGFVQLRRNLQIIGAGSTAIDR